MIMSHPTRLLPPLGLVEGEGLVTCWLSLPHCEDTSTGSHLLPGFQPRGGLVEISVEWERDWLLGSPVAVSRRLGS